MRGVSPDNKRVGMQGWVPSSFLEKFTESLSFEEEEILQLLDCKLIVKVVTNLCLKG